MGGMVQDEGSSSVTSSPLQSFSLMSLSPAAQLMSPPVTWLRELKSDERGLYLIHLLLNCANHVAAGKLEHANACLEHISLLAAPDGDTMQRIASHFTDALARRVLRSWPGLYRALHPPSAAAASRLPPEALLARRHFFDLCPFVRLAFLVSNQAILEAMEGERVVHVVDLGGAASDAAQWAALLQALRARPEGPPHLRLTVVHDQKEFLDVAAMRLSEEAERLDIPFQFHPVLARLENVDVEMLRVKTGEALAISSVLQLHTILAADDDPAVAGHQRKTPSPFTKNSNNVQLHRIAQMSHRGTLGELLEKDPVNGYSPSPDSATSSPLASAPSPKTESFLASLWGLSPKIMTVAEQESNHNGPMLTERFTEALNFYAALFDCLESTAPRMSVERARVEKMLFGEEIKNIITCEGAERRERHEKLEKWVQRLELAGFGRVPLSYFATLQARRLLQGYGCEGYKVREEKGCLFICWQDRPLFSVSAWRFKRFE
ncbi:scarecrow-like protein 3 [Phoenix dactylifera]|uniref:Scarecrow-like protein 3 n=1 Tax=Phoenix dactylifera TaxID=42345 RepID=A0A8B7BH42_PHODC|nr:scarecrow-like protein 3 [Phoenix dactylifera]